MSDEKRFYVNALYYTTETDKRMHFDREKFERLYQGIPNIDEDNCPECGTNKNLDQCRCPDNHRFCKCGCEWQREVNKRTGEVDLIINKHGSKA